jgi:hypothetical protein
MIKELALSAILAISLISCSLSYHFGTLAGRLHERELQRRLRERQIRWREFEEE